MIYLGLYALFMCVIVLLRDWGNRATIGNFLVAERRVGGVLGAMSIAASWIWAPAIFVSTRVGYEWGFSGLCWFVLPNMGALIIFAPLAYRVRQRLPDGFSYIGSLGDHSHGFRETQLIVQLLMQIVIFAIQLTAGAELLSTLTGTPYPLLVLGMGLTPLLYTFRAGLRTSVFTDALQYGVIATAVLLLAAKFPSEMVVTPPRPFIPFDPAMLRGFGISSALGLSVAIFADHQQWQRAFAIRPRALIPTYWSAAILHGLVTTTLGTIGVYIARSNFAPGKTLELVGFSFVHEHYPTIFVPIFVVMALCALISTLDSGLCAFSSLWMTELNRNGVNLSRGRFLMVGLMIAGASASLLHIPLLTLWFIAGTIRLSSFAPTVMSIIQPGFRGRIGVTAIGLGITIGGSLFGVGVWQGDALLRTLGMGTTLVLSLAVCLIGLRRKAVGQEGVANLH